MGKGVLHRIICYLQGYLYIRIAGSNAERFMNLCRHHEIMLQRVQRCGAVYMARIAAKDYFRLRPVIKKTGICPKITERHGFMFFLKRNRKRKILLAAAISFLWLLFFLSGFIWRIDYDGCYYHTREQLEDFLMELGVREGMKKSEADSAAIEKEIRSRFTDIGWVSVEIIGTKMSVMVNETKMPSLASEHVTDGTGEVWNEEHGHIVAAEDGVIAEITAYRGVPLVKAGDVVREGDILISGVITVTGDDGGIVSRYPVLAKGEIKLKTVQNYEHEFPLRYQKKVYSGKEKKGYFLKAFGRKIFSYNPSNSYSECDIISEISQYCLWEDFYLPIWKRTLTFREYFYEAAVYSKEEAKLLAEEQLQRYLSEQKKQGVQILSTDITTGFTGNQCRAAGKIELLGAAWRYRSIIPDEWRFREANEYNTDDD